MKDIQMEEEDLSLVPAETHETNKTEETEEILPERHTTPFSESANNTTERNVNNNEKNGDTANDNPLMPGDESQPEGLINENGEINWNCPCLQGMGNGPCGEEFKDAFSCFHYSEDEPKGVDCLEQFKAMQVCFIKFPEIYGALDEDLDDENFQERSSKDSDGENVMVEENKEILSQESVSTLEDGTRVENVTEK